MSDYKTEGKYRVDVAVADGSTTWASNALRFDTVEEAKAYGDNLSGRWMLVDRFRVVEDATTPQRQPLDD